MRGEAIRLRWRVWLVCALFSNAAWVYACQAEHIDAQAKVTTVYDGDTVRLVDGRRVRMIGLDAPELGHHGEPDQPFAREATAALSALLARHNHRVLIRFGSERRDHYGRWLAHLYLPDRSSLTAHLLNLGLATQLTVPPDTYGWDCFRRAEVGARAASRGIWRLASHQVVPSTHLEPGAQGFRRLRGRIFRVGYSRSAVWLNLEGKVALRIERADLGQFPQQDFSALQGQQVVARGWLYERGGEFRMQIRHPAAFEAIH